MRDWTLSATEKYFWEGAPRRYLGASPSHGSQRKDTSTGCLGGVHWPTDEEYEAIHAAVAIGKRSRWGKIKGKWSVEVKVRNSTHVARVSADPATPYSCSIVRRSNPDSAGCLNEKSWLGIPVWADQSGPSQIRFVYEDTGLFHGLGNCCGGCRSKQPEGHAMRPYTNAQPFSTHGIHWPTDAEYAALQEAEWQVRRLGQNHNINIRVRDGSGNEAHVFWGVRDANDWLSGIWIGRPAARQQIKDWFGVPKWDEPQRQGGNPMKRYPDYHIQGNQIDFRQPARRSFTMTEHIDVHHETIINHIRHAPRQIEHGEAGQQTVYIGGARINMHQLPDQRQQVADRGQVVEVRHQHAALPKPGIRMPGTRPLALPAPERASRGLPAPQQQPMQPVSARARVLAVLNQAKR